MNAGLRPVVGFHKLLENASIHVHLGYHGALECHRFRFFAAKEASTWANFDFVGGVCADWLEGDLESDRFHVTMVSDDKSKATSR